MAEPANTTPSGLGPRVQAARKAREMTQDALAREAEVSQSLISRLESGKSAAIKLRDLTGIARCLRTSLRDLLEGSEHANLLDDGCPDDSFIAFCPNPLCRTNRTGLNSNGEPVVKWESESRYPAEFDDVNYCPYCGDDLVKACSECGRLIGSAYDRYCVRCRTPLNSRPTTEEWEKIRNRHQPVAETQGEDIPF